MCPLIAEPTEYNADVSQGGLCHWNFCSTPCTWMGYHPCGISYGVCKDYRTDQTPFRTPHICMASLSCALSCVCSDIQIDETPCCTHDNCTGSLQCASFCCALQERVPLRTVRRKHRTGMVSLLNDAACVSPDLHCFYNICHILCTYIYSCGYSNADEERPETSNVSDTECMDTSCLQCALTLCVCSCLTLLYTVSNTLDTHVTLLCRCDQPRHHCYRYQFQSACQKAWELSVSSSMEWNYLYTCTA